MEDRLARSSAYQNSSELWATELMMMVIFDLCESWSRCLVAIAAPLAQQCMWVIGCVMALRDGCMEREVPRVAWNAIL